MIKIIEKSGVVNFRYSSLTVLAAFIILVKGYDKINDLCLCDFILQQVILFSLSSQY